MRRIILFDGVCNFCNRTVNIILVHDKSCIYQFAPSQSAIAFEIAKEFGLDQQAFNTVMYIEGDHIFTKTAAIIKISSNLTGWPSLFSLLKFIPKQVADFFYDTFAKYRYQLFGKQLSCMVPDIKYKGRFLV
jgi:predicted DCC family thiol-disulfide oxidoreductase YuxK